MNAARKTRVIVIEGGEMSGKTTIVSNVKNNLKQHGFNVLTTREPGGCKVAEEIRSVLLSSRTENDYMALDKKTEELLFVAARRAHILEKLLPALHGGEYDYIIMDRFIPSSMVYQGYAQNKPEHRETEMERVLHLNLSYTENFKPDLYILLDISPEDALKRKRELVDRNHFDDRDISFHNDLLEGYKTVFLNKKLLNYANSKIVDASSDVDTVTKNVLIQILDLY